MSRSMQRLSRLFRHYRPVVMQQRWLGCPCGTAGTSLAVTSYRVGPHRTLSSGPQRNEATYFLTTPIFYVNAVPHIGHLHTAVLADSVARWYRICGHNVVFSTGTDEHGLKIQQAAKQTGVSSKDLCDRVSSEFKRLFDASNVSYTDYIRTTEDRHSTAVQHVWRTLEENGFIYRGHYEGWYSTPDEAFLTDGDVEDKEDDKGQIRKVSKESGHPVEWVTEENYMFRLSEFTPRLKDWIDTGVVKPGNFEPLVRAWLEEGPGDLSVSRSAERLHWGIPVPGDESQTIYVWLDALVNYLTVAGYPGTNLTWPIDCQVIGKDILRFHAVYWPAFLMAAGLPLPKMILCHSHWTVDGMKMSKSRGNVVDPFRCLDVYTSDGFRYFLLREGVPHSDGNYSERRVVECINSELVNTLGNLLSRTTAPAINRHQVVPPLNLDLFHQRAAPEEHAMLDKLKLLPGLVDGHYRDFCPYRGLEAIVLQLHETNAFVQRHQPWVLVKDSDQEDWLNTVLAVTMETLRVTGILLQPVIPNMAAKLLTRLNISMDHRGFKDIQNVLLQRESTTLGAVEGHLIKRIKA